MYRGFMVPTGLLSADDKAKIKMLGKHAQKTVGKVSANRKRFSSQPFYIDWNEEVFPDII